MRADKEAICLLLWSFSRVTRETITSTKGRSLSRPTHRRHMSEAERKIDMRSFCGARSPWKEWIKMKCCLIIEEVLVKRLEALLKNAGDYEALKRIPFTIFKQHQQLFPRLVRRGQEQNMNVLVRQSCWCLVLLALTYHYWDYSFNYCLLTDLTAVIFRSGLCRLGQQCSSLVVLTTDIIYAVNL